MAELSNLSLTQQLTIDRLPLRLGMMILGLFGVGLSIAMMIRAQIGAAPWDVFHVAVAQQSGLSIGLVTVLTSILVLLLWLPLGSKYGLGTLANALLVGVFADFCLDVLPTAQGLAWGLAQHLAGILLHALSIALYVGAQLGAGPRDGLMTGLHRRFGIKIAPARFAIEAGVCLAGWLLGGPLGLGTLAFALLIGPLCQFFIPKLILPVR